MNYKRLLCLFVMIAASGPAIVQAQCSDFITVDGKKLKCGQNDFFTLVANYWVEVTREPSQNTLNYTYPNYYPSRGHSYFPENQFYPYVQNNAQADSALRKDFRAIKAKGFNTVRLYGCGYLDTISTTDWQGNNYIRIPYTDVKHMALSLDIAGSLLRSAKAAGLKVIFLTGCDRLGRDSLASDLAFHASYIDYLKEFGRRYGNDPTLLAADFFNEPTASGRAYWAKTKACQKVKQWNDALKLHSNALSTIGLWEVNSVFFWDPNLLSVDFISLHNYPTRKINGQITSLTDGINRMKSDYWWYKNNVSLPWIIGETGLTAHKQNTTTVDTSLDGGNSLGTLQEQTTYLHETLNAARDYGATGYSWWEFSDQNPKQYSLTGGGPYWGLIYSYPATPNSTITWKPAAQEITNFNPNGTGTASQPPNYYNYFSNPSTAIYASGVVKDAHTNNPIKDAMVYVVDVAGKGAFSYTDATGIFAIYVNNPIARVDLTTTEGEVLHGYGNFASWSYYLARMNRPTTNNLVYLNASVSSVNVNSYANSYATFTNYQINSSNFKTTAGSYIQLQPGFVATSNTNFNAHIGPYYYDCGSFAFRKGNATQVVDMNVNELQSYQQHIENSDVNKIYPNPGHGLYLINMAKEDKYFIEVYNMHGAKIKSERFTGSNYCIDIQNEATGIYLFNIRNNNELLESTRIIKD